MFSQLLDESCAPQIQESCRMRHCATRLVECTADQIFLDTSEISSEIEAFARNIGDGALLDTIVPAIAHRRGKRFEIDSPVGAQDRSSLDQVRELADVSRPVVILQAVQGGLRERKL